MYFVLECMIQFYSVLAACITSLLVCMIQFIESSNILKFHIPSLKPKYVFCQLVLLVNYVLYSMYSKTIGDWPIVIGVGATTVITVMQRNVRVCFVYQKQRIVFYIIINNII